MNNPTPTLEPVKSSQIAAMAYDAKEQKLTLKFVHGGSVYEYTNFTPDDLNALKAAKSIGSHFLRVIKPRADKWPYKKLEAALNVPPGIPA